MLHKTVMDDRFRTAIGSEGSFVLPFIAAGGLSTKILKGSFG